jgi:hypothetical protein
MGEIITEESFYLIGGVVFLIWGISILLFGHITVKHIEREMAKEGILPPEWDKGIGMRYPTYAGIIMRPNAKRHTAVVDIEATKRFSRKIDWYLAAFVEVSSALFFIVLLIVGIT